jgi:hypothetical protein
MKDTDAAERGTDQDAKAVEALDVAPGRRSERIVFRQVGQAAEVRSLRSKLLRRVVAVV